ncbi:MAG: LiaI-LiaF-like domain-containing protein [Eubacteriaceae bacterium]
MKNRNLFIGLLLIIVGSLWFLDNLEIINFSIMYLVRGITDLWPLALVFLGISILLKNKTIEKFIWVIFLIVIIVYSMAIQYNKFDLSENSTNNINYDYTTYSENIDNETSKGELDLKIGGTRFTMNSDTTEFAELDSNIYKLKHNTNTIDDVKILSISNNTDSIDFVTNDDYYLDLNIDDSIPWDFNIDCGAIYATLDLTNVSMENFNLDMGAGKLELSLSNFPSTSNININCGVSDITLNIPKDAGIKINLEGALNSTNFDSIELNKNGNKYLSSNYDESQTKYIINIEMGLGKFEINYI